MPNINDTYFDGQYKEMWRTIIPEELTTKEIDFMIPYFNLKEGSKVLDMMCGYGRHSIGLAQNGMAVTAVDNLSAYITEIQEIATKEKLSIAAINADIVGFNPEGEYDLAICMGNSFNFFDEADALKIVTTIASSLKKNGHLLINSWSIAEIAFKNFIAKSWSYNGDIKFLIDAKFLLHPTRIETESIMIPPDGKAEVKTGIDYIYSLNEMETMLKKAGLSLKEVYSIPGRKKFTLGEPRAYIIAVKE
jgi:SAM-dependent methyltransferase